MSRKFQIQVKGNEFVKHQKNKNWLKEKMVNNTNDYLSALAATSATSLLAIIV
jgi:hypothetical protein